MTNYIIKNSYTKIVKFLYYQHKHKKELNHLINLLQGRYLTNLGYDIFTFISNHIIDNEH